MNIFIAFGAGILFGAIAGLLIGRKNPKVADLAQQAADKTAASVDKLKS